MFKTSWEICKVFGIPVRLDISLVILLLLMLSYFPSPFAGIFGFVLLMCSIVLHELGHSLTARAFGCRVIDIRLTFIGGMARMNSLPRKAWQEMLVAIAGPAVSLLIALFAINLAKPETVFVPAYNKEMELFASTWQQVFYYSFGWGNLFLFFFNLLPAFPMDGGRVVRSLLQQFFTSRLRATWIAARIGRAMAVFFAVCAVLNIFNVQLIPFLGGTFNLLLIAYFIYVSAENEYRGVLMEEGGYSGNPFPGGFNPESFFRRRGFGAPPPDEGKAVVSPPPYGGASSRVDIKKS